MSDDLVKRLRQAAEHIGQKEGCCLVMLGAADQLEVAQTALMAVTNYFGTGRLGKKYEKQRAVLKQCKEACGE